ncbi:MAG: M20/M25/M40 family metallo-hydrolase, partial [Gemmatimonadetes bacterium]|nr:M20/M25/M40 family metallo-hydrolase [Gemmatimonadota bacterium]
MRQVWLVIASVALTLGCASAPPDGSEVPVLAEVGTQAMPLDLEAVVASPLAAQAAPAPVAGRGTSAAPTTVAAARESGPGGDLSPTERRIAEAVDRRSSEAEAFLQRIVNVNSGTMNRAGVREVGRMFETELAALGFETRWIEMPPEMGRAGHLFAEIDGGSGQRVLLIGHLDTVYESDSPFQSFETLEGGEARGPGVADMKGGDVVILYALKALADAGALADARIVVALLGDEEATGDPLAVSRADLYDAARRSDAALGFEGGVGGLNSATVARRGFTGWTLEVSAIRGHSSVIFSDQYGAGAIFEAARVLSRFYEELRGEEYLTFGAGLILGGTSVAYDAQRDRGEAFGKTNVIPQMVTVAGDLRTLTFDQLESAKARMRGIAAESLPRATAKIRFRDSYPPMAPTEGNYALLHRLDTVSRDLGFGPIDAVDPGRRGAADISFAA